jgi:hypothetical protein
MKHYCPTGRRNHGRSFRDFWIRETGTGQQVALLHDRYMMMMVMVIITAMDARRITAAE